MKSQQLPQAILSVLFGIGSFLFWAFLHPELISFNEQNQLFLFTQQYFIDRISVAGGLADYLSEFLVQFYYYTTAGAFVITAVLLLLHILLYHALSRIAEADWNTYLLSLLPSLVISIHLLDENALLSLPVALILSVSIFLVCRNLGWVAGLITAIGLYWLVGPAAICYLALSLIYNFKHKSANTASWQAIVSLIVWTLWIICCRTFWLQQYPWRTVLLGINYFRATLFLMDVPITQHLVIGSMVAVSIASLIPLRRQIQSITIGTLYVAFLLSACTNTTHDANTHFLLEQLYLTRKADWQQTISQAEQAKQQNLAALESPISCVAINLALAKTGQLPNRMFEFPQVGMQGLLMPNVRDNVSNVVTMEAFWQLGFVNEALRYAFDSQESIQNYRKSGRFTKRLAECNLLNGSYDVASKYIDILKQSLFYSRWAEQAETYLFDEKRIGTHPEWNLKLQTRLENDFLYYYPEMPKMLGQLVIRNRNNQMAMDYFMASLLLTGDARSYLANRHEQVTADSDPFPKGYKDYIDYMQRHPHSIDGVTGASQVK